MSGAERQSAVRDRLIAGEGVNEVARATGMDRKAVRAWKVKLIAAGSLAVGRCECGRSADHRGMCPKRMRESAGQQQAIARRRAAALARVPPLLPAKLVRYPYRLSKTAHGADLVSLVNDLVPKGIDERLRPDVCQELCLAILDGRLTTDRRAIHEAVRPTLTALRFRYESPQLSLGDDLAAALQLGERR